MARRSLPPVDNPPCPPGWAWLLAGIIIGVFLSFLVYVREIAPRNAQVVNSPVTPPTVTDNATKATKPTATASTTAAQFQFYDMLANSKKNPKTATPVTDPHPVAKTSEPVIVPGSYMLQVASYRDSRTAEGMKERLTTLGISAHIQEVTLNGTDQWHRVRIGPFTDINQANQTRAQLVANNISAEVVKF